MHAEEELRQRALDGRLGQFGRRHLGWWLGRPAARARARVGRGGGLRRRFCVRRRIVRRDGHSRALAAFEHVKLFRLLLDGAQREPAREAADIEAARWRVERPFEQDDDLRPCALRTAGCRRTGQGEPCVDLAVGQSKTAVERKLGAVCAPKLDEL